MRLSLLQKQDQAHEDSVWAAAWAPGSNTLVTGSVDESVKLWQEAGDTLEQRHHLVSAMRGAPARGQACSSGVGGGAPPPPPAVPPACLPTACGAALAAIPTAQCD